MDLSNRVKKALIFEEAFDCVSIKGKKLIKYPLYVKVSSFFSIDVSSLRLCGDLWYKKNKSQVVEEIYTLHNELVEKRKVEQQEKRRKEREAAQKKNAQKRKERNKQKKLEDQYKGPYEIAVMNNDTSCTGSLCSPSNQTGPTV